MVGHLASPKPLHIARWGDKGALMGCARHTTGPTGTLSLPTEDQTHTHTHKHSHENKLHLILVYAALALLDYLERKVST